MIACIILNHWMRITITGYTVVIVDAKDGAKHFYERYGFKAFQDAENKLFITISDIRTSLG